MELNPMHAKHADSCNLHNSDLRTEESTWVRDIFQIRSVKKENVDTPSIIVLLMTLGGCAGLVNGLILWASSALSQLQVQVISLDTKHTGIGLVYFWMTSSLFAVGAAILCKYVSPQAAGSGLPEFKYLVASEIKEAQYEKYLSWKVFFAKILGLVLSAGSSMSIGSEGPLVHTAASIAYLLMKYIGEFGDILQSPSLCKQVFAASAAVGVSSAFNAPVGGLLFSIEATSTFYLVSNYWKSFIAAVAGSVACNIFLMTKGATSDPLLTLNMAINEHPFVKVELFLFLLIGIALGYLAHFYLRLHQKVNETLRVYSKPYPLVTVWVAVLVTSTMIYITRAYDNQNIGVIALVSDVLTDGRITEMENSPNVTRLGGLFVSFLTRSLLTLLATNIPIPAGIFMPVFLIGGILGRFIGTVLNSMLGPLINIPAYALVGACAFAAGVTHTISVAVIAMEMTGNIHMLLPCLLVSVVAAGIAKANGSSVYDQGMVNKGLESFQLLMMDAATKHSASDIMDVGVCTIPLMCSLADLTNLLKLTEDTQDSFPVVESRETMKVVGSILRSELFVFLFQKLSELGYSNVLSKLLKIDYDEYVTRLQRKEIKLANNMRKKKISESFWSAVDSITSENIFFGDSGIKAPMSRQSEDDGNLQSFAEAGTPPRAYSSIPTANDIESGPPKSKRASMSPISGLDNVATSIASNAASLFDQVIDGADSAARAAVSGIGSINAVIGGKDGVISAQANQIDEAAVKQVLEAPSVIEPLNLLEEKSLPMNNHPFTVDANAPMEQVYILFEMVKVPCVLVVSDGKLSGMISRNALLASLKKKI